MRQDGILLTTVVGSYPQPDWLIDRARLGGRLPPRTRALELWRVAPEHLEQAQDDATLLAVQFLRASTGRPIKATLPGPFTMSQQAQDDYYGDEAALAMDLAAAVNAEVRDLFRAGADVVQIDEPYLQARAEKAAKYAIK